MKGNDYYFFIDESGDHNLTKVDSNYPIFALGGLCISKSNYEIFNTAVDELKDKYFGGTDIILHSSELKRPKDSRSDSRTLFLLDQDNRIEFYKYIDNIIIRNQNFSLAACFIHKQLHVDYYSQPVDPYYFSFENILNRVLWYVGDNAIEIIAENRGQELDSALLAEYELLKVIGTKFHTNTKVVTQTSLVCASKKENINGLQIIDLILSTLTRHYLGKTAKMVGNDLTPEFIERKYMFKSPTFFPLKREI